MTEGVPTHVRVLRLHPGLLASLRLSVTKSCTACSIVFRPSARTRTSLAGFLTAESLSSNDLRFFSACSHEGVFADLRYCFPPGVHRKCFRHLHFFQVSSLLCKLCVSVVEKPTAVRVSCGCTTARAQRSRGVPGRRLFNSGTSRAECCEATSRKRKVDRQSEKRQVETNMRRCGPVLRPFPP
jgi:hypothetical protein